MIAYKGFNKDLQSVMGNGDAKTCNFTPGETLEVQNCKTAREGFHCYENPFRLPTYYSMDGENRYFKVEAAGNMDEDEQERIACTKITLLEELTPWMLAMEGMRYMIEHPLRDGWRQTFRGLVVAQDKAEAEGKDCIAIARGAHPRARGAAGSILGLLVDDGTEITECKLIRVSDAQAGRWLSLQGREVAAE
jgi:hypothetical protein